MSGENTGMVQCVLHPLRSLVTIYFTKWDFCWEFKIQDYFADHRPALWGKENGRQVLSSWKSHYPETWSSWPELHWTLWFSQLFYIPCSLFPPLFPAEPVAFRKLLFIALPTERADVCREEAFSFSVLLHSFIIAKGLAFPPSNPRSVIDHKRAVSVQVRSPSCKVRKHWHRLLCTFMCFVGSDCAHHNILNFSVSYYLVLRQKRAGVRLFCLLPWSCPAEFGSALWSALMR